VTIDLSEGNQDSLAHDIASFAVLAVRIGKMDSAVRLLGAAAALREAFGGVLALPERATYERAMNTARAALGEEAFTAAWAAGGAGSREEAIMLTREVAAAAMTPAPTSGLSEPAARHGLTLRELEVLRLVVAGRSNAQIADVLFISPRTVSTHLTSTFNKLSVSSRTEAIAAAHHLDLV
jgi:DNA-binding CsgD family transcriptional regulator